MVYYDEDDIKIDKLPANVKSAASNSTPKQVEVKIDKNKAETPKLKIKPKLKSIIIESPNLFDELS